MSKQHYFSNGTEGEIWMRQFCYRCVHDHSFHPGGNESDPCQHQCNLYIAESDPVFIAVPMKRADGTEFPFSTWDCVEFARCACDNGADDPGVEPPPPVDPNQGLLFPTDDLMPGVWRDVVLDELSPAEVES